MNLDPLRSSRLLSGLSDDTLHTLLEHGRLVTVAPDEVLLAEGETADALYVVLEGELDVTKRTERAEVPIARVGPGEVIGELAVVRGQPRSATVRAASTATLLCVDTATLDRLLVEPKVGRALLSTVTRRVEELELQLRHQDRMATLGTMTAGLLHELNNPAAAIARSVARLDDAVGDLHALDGALTDPTVRERLDGLIRAAHTTSTPLQRLDAEAALGDVLSGMDLPRPRQLAAALAELGLTPADVDAALGELTGDDRAAAVRWLAARGRLARLLAEAAAGAARISEVVGAVKRYAHVDEAPVQQVDVHEGLEAALTLLRSRVPSGVKVTREYAEGLPTIEGFPGDLNAVWTNLLDNALDAVGESGSVTVRTQARSDAVVVEVENTGPEVSDEVLARVFDPFFTTKPIGHGTGLGLAMARTVVEQQHRGELSMTSDAVSTVARVVLPHRPP